MATCVKPEGRCRLHAAPLSVVVPVSDVPASTGGRLESKPGEPASVGFGVPPSGDAGDDDEEQSHAAIADAPIEQTATQAKKKRVLMS
jgi:hypothetical protein